MKLQKGLKICCPYKKKDRGKPVSLPEWAFFLATAGGSWFPSTPNGPEVLKALVFQHGGWPASRPSRSTYVGHLRSPHRGSRTLAGLSFHRVRFEFCRIFVPKKVGENHWELNINSKHTKVSSRSSRDRWYMYIYSNKTVELGLWNDSFWYLHPACIYIYITILAVFQIAVNLGRTSWSSKLPTLKVWS